MDHRQADACGQEEAPEVTVMTIKQLSASISVTRHEGTFSRKTFWLTHYPCGDSSISFSKPEAFQKKRDYIEAYVARYF